MVSDSDRIVEVWKNDEINGIQEWNWWNNFANPKPVAAIVYRKQSASTDWASAKSVPRFYRAFKGRNYKFTGGLEEYETPLGNFGYIRFKMYGDTDKDCFVFTITFVRTAIKSEYLDGWFCPATGIDLDDKTMFSVMDSIGITDQYIP